MKGVAVTIGCISGLFIGLLFVSLFFPSASLMSGVFSVLMISVFIGFLLGNVFD